MRLENAVRHFVQGSVRPQRSVVSVALDNVSPQGREHLLTDNFALLDPKFFRSALRKEKLEVPDDLSEICRSIDVGNDGSIDLLITGSEGNTKCKIKFTNSCC